jgi:hypothetical protein
MEQLAERGSEIFMRLAAGNVFLAGLLKLVSKTRRRLASTFGNPFAHPVGKIRAPD